MNAIHIFLVHIWLAFLALFLILYVILDGFDLGAGVLSLFAREHERRDIVVASVSSVWDANETWLVVLAGTLFGSFPMVYGTVLNALYLPVIVMIFALIFRGVAFEFREHSRLRMWDFSFGLGSLVAALCQGFFLGGLIAGPNVKDGHFGGGAFDWFSAFSTLVALGVVFGYVLLGATYLIAKTARETQTHAFAAAWIAGAFMLIAAIGVSVWTPIRYPYVAHKWFADGAFSVFAIPPGLGLLCTIMLVRALWKRQEYAPFWWSVGIFIASITGLTSSLYPYLVPGAVRAGSVASDDMTLVSMMLGIGLLTPLMITYNAYQYLVFRGKIFSANYGG